MPINTAPSLRHANTGYVIGNLRFGLDMSSMTVQPDGRILGLASHGWLSRIFPDGRVDGSFSGWGHQQLWDQAAHTNFGEVLLLDAGKFLVISSRLPPGKTSYNQEAIVLERYNADGSLDTQFGNGSGRSFIDSDPRGMEADLNAVRLRDGSIVVAATSYQVAPSGDGYGWNPYNGRLSLARYRADGTPDTSFGTGGGLTLPEPGLTPEQVAVQPDGKIIVVGRSYEYWYTWKVLRFNPDGTLDQAFGDRGMITEVLGESHIGNRSSVARDVLIQPDGKIVVVGAAPAADQMSGMQDGLTVIRYLPNGQRDTTFNGDGMFLRSKLADAGTRLPPASDWGMVEAHKVAIDDMGRLLIAGVVHHGGTGTQHLSQLVFIRLRADGSFDPAFGSNGITTVSVPGARLSINDAVMLDNGELFISGVSSPLDGGAVSYLHARLLPDGRLNPGFGSPSISSANEVTVQGAHGVTVLAPGANVTDSELDQSNYAGATLTLQRQGIASAEDVFVGSKGLVFEQGHALLDGVEIGTASNVGGKLSIVFNKNATPTVVDRALQSIGYVQGHAGIGDVILEWTFSDGNTGRQGDGGALSARFTTTVHLNTSDVPYWIGSMLDKAYPSQDPARLREDLLLMIGAERKINVRFGAESGSLPLISEERTALSLALASFETKIDLHFGVSGIPLDIRASANLARGTASAHGLLDYGNSIWFSDLSGADQIQADVLRALGHVFGLSHPMGEPTDSIFLTEIEIAALQYLYGPSTSSRIGDDTYLLNASTSNFIWDGKGIDTISAEGISEDVTVHLQPGFWDSIGQRGTDITAAGQVTVNYGSTIENAIGGNGNDQLFGTSGVNSLTGGAGDDVLHGLGGHDILDGSNGTDTAAFAAVHDQYTVQKTTDGWKVTSRSDSSDIALLTSIERLHFADGYFSYEVHGNAAQVYRLYQAVFGRAPDGAGLGFWMHQMDQGASLQSVAIAFMAAGEFAQRFGTYPSSTVLIGTLYQNVLHRTPDTAGFNWWKDLLDKGVISQEKLLTAFSESPENVAQLTGQIQAGMEYVPFH